MNDLHKLPISFVPNADTAYTTRYASDRIKRLYVTLLWLSLPIVAVFRRQIGVRYISDFNIFCSFLLLSFIGYQVCLFQEDLYVPFVNSILPNVKINFIFAITIFLTVVFSHNFLVLSFIAVICILGSFFIEFNSFSYGRVLLFLISTHFLILIRSSKFNKGGKNVNSYFFGYNILNDIVNLEELEEKATLEGIIFTIALLFITYFYLPAHRRGEEIIVFAIYLIIISIANYFLNMMQRIAVKQYQQDLLDAEAPLGSGNSEDNALEAHRVKPVR